MKECKHEWVDVPQETTICQQNKYKCRKCGLMKIQYKSTSATESPIYYYQPEIINTKATME